MQQAPAKSLRERVADKSPACCLCAPDAHISLSDIAERSLFGNTLHELAGRSLLIATSDQLTTALAAIELDGVARRLILCTPDLPAEHLSEVIAAAEADGVVHDGAAPINIASTDLQVGCSAAALQPRCTVPPRHTTEWILLTSGTSGLPKLVV